MSMFIISCSEENFNQGSSMNNSLSFSVDITEKFNVTDGTRSATGSDPIPFLTRGGLSLYLHEFTGSRQTSSKHDTRGSLVNVLSDIDKFGVNGYSYAISENLADKYPNFLYDATVVKNSDGIWNSTKEYYWIPQSSKTAFCAYYPQGNSNVVINSVTSKWPMTVKYTVDNDISKQVDLLTAHVENETFTPPSIDKRYKVPINFSHALTAIHLEIDEIAPAIIKSVSFTNICTEGIDTISKGWNYVSWGDFTIDYTSMTGGGFPSNSGDIHLTASEQPLLMIPQPLGKTGQYLAIVVDDGTPQTLLAELKGNWTAGTQVTYRISTSPINILNIENVEYPKTWGEETFLLKQDYVNNSNETLGVYAVEKETGKIIKKNIKYTLTNGRWQTDNGVFMPYKKNYEYYAYYPYQSDIEDGYASSDYALGNADTTFFSALIKKWKVSDDQSNETKLLANDLQVAKANIDTPFRASFTMSHQMGLGAILLGKKTGGEIVRYFLATNKAKYYETGATTLTATELLKDDGIHKPYLHNRSLYYYIMGNGQKVTFDSEDGLTNEWVNEINVKGIQRKTDKQTALPNITTTIYEGYYYEFINNTIQSYTVNTPGTYTLEVWGAQGGTSSNAGGKGGYTKGTITYGSGVNQTLYICVGGKGANNSGYKGGAGGYNGGGNGQGASGANGSGGGGGATHIATTSGILKNVARSNVLIVAGGGGGACQYSSAGGYGGGTSGGNVSAINGTVIKGGSTGGAGYQYGQGQNGRWGTNNPAGGAGTGGGGGGYYGGAAQTATGNQTNCAGAGGCGYVKSGLSGTTTAGNVQLPSPTSNGNESGVGHAGNGYARIATPKIITSY